MPLIIIGAVTVLVLLFLAISPSAIPNGEVFHLEGEPHQSISVDGVYLRIPDEFMIDPKSIDFNVNGGVMSSTQGWSHENEYIGLMVVRLPYSRRKDVLLTSRYNIFL